ncbi:MAG: ABC transporter permease, partial [Terriglobia bacterium]
MTWLRMFASRLSGLFRKTRSERELDEELRLHIEMLADENARKGMSPEEARRAARREFGGVAQIKEKYRDQRGVAFIETIVQDLRYGLRQLGRNPGFAAVAVITLALGIGANTVIFSAVNAELLHPFPFKHLSRIVTVWEEAPKQNQSHVSAAPANFLDWSKQNTTFDLLAADHDWNVNLTGRGLAERVEGYQVTANFFPLLGVAPQLGRSITATDFHPGQESVVVFSYGFWQRHLGADHSIVGKSILLNNQKFIVIGIVPKDFDYPLGAEAWSPLNLMGAAGADRADHYLEVIGRLKPGVSAEQAQADLGSIAQRLGQQYPKTNAGHGVQVVGLVQDLTSAARQFLALLMGAAAFVLLLACANVMNLQLARAAGRQKEIAVRLALGGSRWRITRQLLVETLILAALGGLAGALLASWGLH